jgi:nucleotide-binding universal stress UspA family protein
VVKTILVAIDCSKTSEEVFQALEVIYIEAHTKIILCHVLPSADGNESQPDRPHQSASLIYQKVEQELQEYQSELPGSQIEIATGDPAEEIIRLANIHHADLIVIGTRGLKGVERVIEDSVSGQVVAEATCSVLVVKS